MANANASDSVPETTASFRVMGVSLDPVEVSRLLATLPSEAHKRGDANVGKEGRRYADFSEGLWALRSAAVPTATPAEHILDLVRRLSHHKAELRQLAEQGLRLDVFVGVFGSNGNAALELGPLLLKELADLGLTLSFDIYP